MQAQQIAELIQAKLPDAKVSVEGADGQHFEAQIVSAEFDGLRSLQRHRLVYSALGDLISSGALHALSLRTQTPAEADAIAADQP